jgi:glucose-1-phosphate thymidylyltransferase
MKAILLAAGYGTRLYPLTENLPKTLLPIAGRPMLDWIADKVDEVAEVDALHVVTNARFAEALGGWAADRRGRLVPVVHDDGTTTNEDRLGAIGDVAFVLERAGIASEDLLVVAGDNLFDGSLADYVAWWRRKGDGSAIAVRDCGDLELARQYAIVGVDDDDRIVSFVEKPTTPPGTLASTATYIYHREHVPLVATYLAEGNPPDAPGNFIAWLYTRRPVYAYRLDGVWFDIGDHDQLRVADNTFRERLGLAARERYAL